MWTGRPLLVERVDPGYRHPGIRYVAWTGSHRIAAAFAAGQWLVPILEIDKSCWDRAHGKPKTTRLSETYDDESRLARLLTTEDERAIRLMQREIPRADKDKKARAERQRAQLAKQAKDDALWKSLGENLQARVKAERGKLDLIEVRDKATREAFVFHKVVLEKLLETLRAETGAQTNGSRA
jgi:hypothetical protein